jgi:hypothetical protein
MGYYKFYLNAKQYADVLGGGQGSAVISDDQYDNGATLIWKL